MSKWDLTKSCIRLLLLSLLSFTVSTFSHAQPELTREEVSPTGQWLDATEARFTGRPILLHLRTGHERALLMPEPVRLADSDYRSSGHETDINGDVVRFYPLSTFGRESIRLIGLETDTEYVFRIRASAFGIRQPLTIILAD